MNEEARPRGAIAAIVEKFLSGQLAILMLIAALALGIGAILMTPREEEPQIVVPLADLYVRFPGASAEEVEKLVATPLERLLWQIDGVEYVYSVARRGLAVVTVRFFVGEDRERSLVKLHNRVSSHIDEAPPGVTGWVIKPIEIDDVPIVNLTFYSDRHDDHALRRVVEEVQARLDVVEDISRTEIHGGRELEVRVELLPEAMEARGLGALEVQRALMAADAAVTAGTFDRQNRQFTVTGGPFLTSGDDVGRLVVGLHRGHPVYIRDIARILPGPREAHHYTRIGLADRSGDSPLPAVTLAIAKKRGVNAVWVADAVLAQLEELKQTLLPDGVHVRVTRNYGVTADNKVNELLTSLGFAMVTVIGLLVLVLGWREGMIVALSVPLSFALALFVNLIFGYTINRVTLFALILTLGLVVDDPIINVDNIRRHILLRKRKPFFATLWAVEEVLPPVIMSTLTIIVSFLPMFFITGMMGPYMGPMAINVPLAVIFSTVAALTVVPWASYQLLKRKAQHQEGAADMRRHAESADWRDAWIGQSYMRFLGRFLDRRSWRIGLFVVVLGLLGLSGLLVLVRAVPLKMLPFDNKNELQLVIDLPEGTSLEKTDAVLSEFEDYLFTVPEMVDFESYVGTHSPIDFNGMVRHYYFREAPYQADIRINLVDKERRSQQSHEIALRLRHDLQEIAQRHNATLAIVESPPGPPVIATVVAEIYGSANLDYGALIGAAREVAHRMGTEPGVVDIDTTAEDPHQRIEYILDKEKAGLHGITTGEAVQTLQLALHGATPATVHRPTERNPVLIRLQLPRAVRSGIAELGRITVKGRQGELVPLAELGTFRRVVEDQPIYHKNLERVVYVMGEMAGRAPGEAILDLKDHFSNHPLPSGTRAEWGGEGEWKITLRVFRDLGIAFGTAMIGIYILLVVQTGSFGMPLVIMTAIPLTAIGIMPGFFLLNLIVNRPIDGWDNPVFFTATAMIGMIALGGIVVRNSIVLIEFIQDSRREGMPVNEAILQSGAIRMRPILLTAATTALGAWPITLDPIFSGLAWALIFGLFASTAFTLIIVPVIYFLLYAESPQAAPSSG